MRVLVIDSDGVTQMRHINPANLGKYRAKFDFLMPTPENIPYSLKLAKIRQIKANRKARIIKDIEELAERIAKTQVLNNPSIKSKH